MPTFLHGVETVTTYTGATSIQVPGTNVIGILGLNGVGSTSATPADLGIPKLILPSQTLDSQGLLPTWTVYKAIKTIFEISSPLVIWIPCGEATVSLVQGADKFRLAMSMFGFSPKILLSAESATSPNSSLLTVAAILRAMVLVPIAGASVAAMVTARATLGDARYVLCGHNVTSISLAAAIPSTWVMAGVMARTDDDPSMGFWFSPSNKPVTTFNALDLKLTSSLTDSSSDVNTLNAAGICTFYNSWGTGYRTWGNRNASFPVSSGISTFISVQRTADAIADAIEAASLTYIDRPINRALIDTILENINAFLRRLIGLGALVDGSASFENLKNPNDQIANGQLVISYQFVPPPPLERLTFVSFLNINLLSSLTTGA